MKRDAVAVLPVFQKLRGRYEFQSVLRQGGMGVIYRAYDLRVKRLVAVKTIRDTPDETALQLFERECRILAQLSHPNIVEIFDVGEFEEAGARKPYFIMPLLAGRTLEEIIRDRPEPIPVGRSVDILSQACRGLQAAHDQGLLHRDLKPSNIFVLDDDSVKIIDFGVAHIMSATATIGRKGTPYYMAPEQIELGPLTSRSDQFALGVVAWQLFTGRRPFDGPTEREVVRAILHHVPPPASAINPEITDSLSQAAAKAMAKKPQKRWESLREFSGLLQVAYHNGRIPALDPERFRPLLERAARALDEGDAAFADEILGDLEDEGCTGQQTAELRSRIDTVKRRTMVQELLASARKRFQEGELPFASQKIAEILAIDAAHTEALALREEVTRRQREEETAQWLRIAAEHLEAGLFAEARNAAGEILQCNSAEERAHQLIEEIDRREAIHNQVESFRAKLHDEAVKAWESGAMELALAKLERLMSIGSAPDHNADRMLYDQVRAEKDLVQSAYVEARQQLASGNLDAALEYCNRQLARSPENAQFHALRVDVEEARRQRASIELAEIDRRAEDEPDLGRKVDLLQSAASRFPADSRIRAALEAATDRRDLVRKLAEVARNAEENGRPAEALEKWIAIRNAHSRHPHAEQEIDRLRTVSTEQTRLELQQALSLRIQQQIEDGQIGAGGASLHEACREFPGDPEFAELDKLIGEWKNRQEQAQSVFRDAQALWMAGRHQESLTLMRAARQQDPHNTAIRFALVDSLLESATGHEAGTDWSAVRISANEALALDPGCARARELLSLAESQSTAAKLLHTRPFPARETGGVAEVTPPKPSSRLETLAWESASQQSVSNAAEPAPAPGWRPAGGPASPATKRVTILFQNIPGRQMLLVGGSAAAMLLVAFAIAALRHAQPRQSVPSAAAPASIPLHIRTAPIDAEIRVDGRAIGKGDATSALPPGRHYLQASRSGYRTGKRFVNLTRATSIVNISLIPQFPLDIRTDATDAQARIDDGRPGDVHEGLLEVPDITPGKHQIVFKSQQSEAWFSLETSDAGPIIQPGAIVSPDVLALLAATGPKELMLYASKAGVRAAVDHGTPAVIGDDGLHVAGVKPGSHRIELFDHGDRTDFPLEVGNAPGVTAFVHAGLATGAITLHTDEPGATILVNSRKLSTLTRQGDTHLLGFPPGKYNLSIEKNGFESVPVQTVEVFSRKTAEVRFDLKRLPPPASQLYISGAVAGAEVLLDHVPIGTTQDGSLSRAGIAPGDHWLELRHIGYRPKTLSLHFDPGQDVRVSPSDIAMVPESRPATVNLNVVPPEAKVSFGHPGEPLQAVDARKPISVAKGTWAFSATADGYTPLSTTVTVGDGERKDLQLKLVRKAVEKPDMLTGWQHRETWTREGTGYVHEGGGFVLFDPAPLTGSITFSVTLRKTKRLRWTYPFRNDQNYFEFELGRNSFSRYRIDNGKRTRVEHLKIEADPEKPVFIQILLKPDNVRHLYSTDGNHWREIDNWNHHGEAFDNGRFGFVLQDKETIVLSRFTYAP